jgi:trimeric autotransporter adhesin
MKPNTLSLIFFPLFTYFAAALGVKGVVPTPDGCYPNFTTAEGCDALHVLTSGVANTGVGWRSLFSDSVGSLNTGVGAGTLVLNTADSNTAVGAAALLLNTTGASNTAVGGFALFNNNIGQQNIAIGDGAMPIATGAFSNTVVGTDAGQNIVTGVEDTYIGAFVGPASGPDESFTVRIADSVNGLAGSQCFIGGISGVTGANFTDTVTLDPVTGQLGDGAVSSAQFKKDIDPMGNTSEAIFSLRPVTFHYKNDPTDTPQFGLIAEEVAKVNPALVGVDKEGKPHSVQYMKIEAMLLNEFLKEHKKVEEQQSKIDNQQASIAELRATVAQQAKGMEVLTTQLKEQAAQIQKVSTQLELSKAAPQTVLNNQ